MRRSRQQRRCGIDIGALIEQSLGSMDVAIERREVEWREAVLIGRIDSRHGEQHGERRRPASRGEMVDEGVALGAQQRDATVLTNGSGRIGLLGEDGDVEWRRAVVVLRVDRRAARQV